MTTFFTGTRTPQNSDWSVNSTGTGATLYAFITTGGRAEWSPLSPSKTIVYDPVSPDFSVTINGSLRTSGTWLWEVAVAFSPTNNPQDAIFAAAYRCLESDQATQRALPATITFNNVALVKTTPASIAVATASDLATVTPKLHGMIRSVTSEGGAVYRWDAVANAWVPWRSSSAYQIAPRKPANEIDPAIDWYLPPPVYPQSALAEGSPSLPIQFWLLNDGGAEWTTGDGIDLQVAVGGDLTLGYLMSGLCKCRVLGSTDPTTGVLNTSNVVTPNVNVTYTWQNTDSWLFQLINTVPTGAAIHVEVWVQYYKSQLRVPSGSLLQIIPFNIGKFAYQTPGFAGFDDWLVGLRLLPRIGGLSDTGGSAKIGDWQFSDTPANFLTSGISIPSDSERQIIVDAQARSLVSEAVGTAIDNSGTYRTEGLVGIVKTLPGVGPLSSPVSLNSTSGSISVTLVHPVAVTTSYPVIGGLTAQFNVPTVYVYLTVSGTIYRTAVAVTPGTQTINITALGTVVSSPLSATFTHTLFPISTPTIAVGSLPGTIPNGSLTCNVQYAYPTPNSAISVIEMEGAGMLRQQSEILGTLPGFWGILNPTQLRQLDTSSYTGKEWGRVIIGGVSKPFRFDPNSTVPDDNVLSLKPNDRTGAGRYVDELIASIELQGIGSLNGLTASIQSLATGVSGTDFNIVSNGATHTLNLPTVSSSNRGVLTPAMYNDLNSRQADWTAASGSPNSILNVPATFPPSTHNQDASTINSGTLDPARIPEISYTKIQNVSTTNRFIGRITAGSGKFEELTGTQATSLLDTFTSTVKGLVPASGGSSTAFLRADGVWATPAGGGGGGGGGSVPTITTISSSTNTLTITGISQIIRADCTSNNVTATLPTAVGNAGYIYWIKRVVGGSNSVTINGTSSQTIDGALTVNLTVDKEAIGVFSNGDNWEII